MYRFSPYFLLLLALCVTLSAPPSTSAQTTSTEVAPTSSQATTTEKLDISNETTDSTVLPTRAQTRIRNLAANISNRMDAAIDRLDNISDRTESRIEKLTARGIDTANARRLLARVRTNLMQAGASMETIDTAVATFVSASEPAAEWQRVSAQFVDTRTSIVGAHQTLQVVVDELKQVISSGANIENASTSGTSE